MKGLVNPRKLFFRHLRSALIASFNPALCLTCGIPVRTKAFICQHCLETLLTVSNPCTLCGLPNMSTGPVCPSCLYTPPCWHHMIAPLIFTGGSRHLIHDLKFQEQPHISHALISHFVNYYTHRSVDVLIPVPLHKTRLLERGFNQADEVAGVLSKMLKIKVDRKSLRRVKETQSQSGLSLDKRRKNILHAFEFSPRNQYRSVAIIDDVITTGSTMTEICRLLSRSGIKTIEVWSLARALKHY